MSFLSSIAPALGGIGQGVTQGLNALNQQEQQKFQKEQQDRLRQSWQDQDATNAQLKGIPTTTPDQWGPEYEYAKNNNLAMRDDNGQLMPGVKAGTARPTYDILADQARIYMNSTDSKNKALGLQLADKATQLENTFKLNKANTARDEMLTFLNERGPEEFANRYGNLFQQNKLGPDELTSATVNGGNGEKQHVIINRNTGKEVSRLPITRAAAIDAIDALHGHNLASISPELYFQNQQVGISRNNLGVQQGLLAVHQNDLDLKRQDLEEKIKHNLFGAQANQLNSSANASNAAALASNSHARYFDAMVESTNGNKEAQATAREYSEKFAALSPEDQNGPKGQALIAEGIAATAKKSGDLVGLINSLKKPVRPINEKEQEQAFKDLAAASNLKEVDFVHAKWPNVFGPDPLEKAYLDATKPKTEGPTASATAPSPAPKGLFAPLPNQSNPKLIRERNPRGGYTYTPSPRGMTRAEWDKLDQSKQR